MVGGKRTYPQGNRAVFENAYAQRKSVYSDSRVDFRAGSSSTQLLDPWLNEYATRTLSLLDEMVASGKTPDAEFSQRQT